MDRTTQYPHHLAKLVAARLRAEQGQSPPESVLTRLLETLYFASLKTDEGRRILCTVNYADPREQDPAASSGPPADRWSHVRFDRPLPLDVRTLTKLARAADPAVSSLAVFSDKKGKLFIWAMVDQEPRHGDYITLEADTTPQRPGLFQTTITGVGNISVYRSYTLIGSLSHNILVQAYHDVLWSGPVHAILEGHLRCYLAEECPALLSQWQSSDAQRLQRELLLRWLNAISRVLVSVQQYRHGGGLLISPHASFEGATVKYRIKYDRLMRSLLGLIQAQSLSGRAASEPVQPRRDQPPGVLPPDVRHDPNARQKQLEEHKNEILGAVRFIAALSCVDGVVLLDKSMAVHGFGAELRTDNHLSDVFMAGDSQADPARLRKVELTQFGTRHRAMIRYCYQNQGALGFVVSQDGDIQAMTRIGEKLILWENIDVQLAFKAQNWFTAEAEPAPLLRRLRVRATD